jgi:radical SAM protein with 4Fe4S-binding SPASM domain
MIPVPEQDWTEEQYETMKQELRKISDYYIEQYRQGDPIYIKHIDDGLKSIVSPKRRKSHCGAGRGYVLVKTDGTLYPCHRFGGDIDAEGENQQKWKLGTIFDGWDDNDKRDKLLEFDCRKHVKADCENCIAVHMCGTTCIAISWSCFQDIYTPHPNQCLFTKMFFEEAMRVHYILDCENNHTFIKKYHPERLRRNRKRPNRRHNTQQSSQQTTIHETVFVMLSSRALSPCFMFNGKHHNTQVQLSVENLKGIMKWATQESASVPNLLFLADETTQLEPSIAKFLENIPEQILMPLVSLQRQNQIQIPFSEKQVVITSNLQQLVTEKESISNRPVIAHVDHSEIEHMTDLLVSIKDRIPQITLRLRNAHELRDDQIELYEKQLNMLRDVLRLESFLNLNGIRKIHLNGANHQYHCPAGRQLITIGPDGLVYPCPTFYLSGSKGRSLDSLKGSNGSPFSIVDTEPGCICNSEKCPGCEFLKLSGDEKSNRICNVYKAEIVAHA